MIHQVLTIVLPQAGAGAEVIADALTHPSIEFPVKHLQEKMAYVYGIIVAGAPGPLNVWVEIAPDANVLTGAAPGAANYVPLGIPSVLVATGGLSIPWTAHSDWSRIVAQAMGAGVAASWAVVIIFGAKTP